MKNLFILLLACICYTSFAQEVQKPVAPKPPRERRHMIVFDGAHMWGIAKYPIRISATESTRHYDGYGVSVGYRYCFYDFMRIGADIDLMGIDFNRWQPGYNASFHIEAPVYVTDRLFISPSVRVEYEGIDDIPNGKFRVGGSVGIMYTITKGLAVNLEPGYRYYKPLLANEFPVKLGVRFLL